MEKELEQYYEARFTMFASKGWKDLMEDLESRIEAIESIRGIKNSDELFKRQGELDCLEWLTSLEELSNDVYNELKEAHADI